MGVYLFRVIPGENEEPIELAFASDDEALADARRALNDLARDAAIAGTTPPRHIEVSREDGDIVGVI